MDDIFEKDFERQLMQLKNSVDNISTKFSTEIDNNGVVIVQYLGIEEEVVIPDFINGQPVYKIGEQAFFECANLKKVEIPSSVTEIDDAAFCASGIEEITLPKGLKRLGRASFADTNLRTVVIPSSVKIIEDCTFAGSKLEMAMIKGAEIIEEDAFNTEFLRRISFSDKLRVVKSGAFGENPKIKRLIFPKSVQQIYGSNLIPGVHTAILNNDCNVSYCHSSAFNYHIEKPIIYCNVGSPVYREAKKECVIVKPLSEFPLDEEVDEIDDNSQSDGDNNNGNDNRKDVENSGELDASSWNLESILRREGYTVSQKEDLSDYERQQILLSVMRRNLMSKWQIIEHIELQISLRRNNRVYSIAISKWERDLAVLRRL